MLNLMITFFSPFTVTFSCPPLPTLPIPPPQLTTDIQGTLPLTAQRPITDEALTTTTSRNDINGGTQTGLLMTTTGAGSGEPTTSEAVAESSDDINVNAIVGGIVGVGLVILTLSVVTIVFITAVVVGKKKCHSTSFPLTPNQAYGINVTPTCGEEKAYYDYPAVVDLDTTIEVKQNEVYSLNIITTGNEAYATNIFTAENEAYYAGIDIAI